MIRGSPENCAMEINGRRATNIINEKIMDLWLQGRNKSISRLLIYEGKEDLRYFRDFRNGKSCTGARHVKPGTGTEWIEVTDVISGLLVLFLF